jgi:ABC-type transport system involved in multi-copper enzyme maturation permease subunit
MEQATATTTPSNSLARRVLRGLTENPVALKELRSRMRGRRAFLVLSVYLGLMAVFIWFVYLFYYQAANNTFGPAPNQAGKVVFTAVLGIQAFLIVFIGPAFTAGAISGEKERQTYDLLRTTLLPAGALVRGKLISALSYVFLLVLAAIPLQSVAFLLGGVALVELLISQAVILVAAVTYALLGLFASSLMRSTLAASVTTYALAIFFILGIPLLIGSIIGFVVAAANTPSAPSWLEPMMLLVGWYGILPTNLPATLVASELILLEEGTLWYFSQTVNGYTIYLLSPWYLFLALYTVLSILLYLGCIWRVRRIPKR